VTAITVLLPRSGILCVVTDLGTTEKTWVALTRIWERGSSRWNWF